MLWEININILANRALKFKVSQYISTFRHQQEKFKYIFLTYIKWLLKIQYVSSKHYYLLFNNIIYTQPSN